MDIVTHKHENPSCKLRISTYSLPLRALNRPLTTLNNAENANVFRSTSLDTEDHPDGKRTPCRSQSSRLLRGTRAARRLVQNSPDMTAMHPSQLSANRPTATCEHCTLPEPQLTAASGCLSRRSGNNSGCLAAGRAGRARLQRRGPRPVQ